MEVPDLRKFWVRSLAGGLILSALLFAAVFLGGQTFGQRCGAAYAYGSAAWEACVDRLVAGGKV